jgi:thiol-disulfide isomerase/thioredoxin
VTLPRRALLATLALLGAGAARAQSQPPGKGDLQWVEPGRVPSAPLFAAALVDLDHRPASVPRTGRPMLVNFWARWCGPCKVEIPELQALHARKAGVDVLGIALENQGSAVRDFARAYEMDYPLLLARDGAGLDLMRALGNPTAGLPFTLVLDRQGQVQALRLGLLTRAQLDAAVQRVLR